MSGEALALVLALGALGCAVGGGPGEEAGAATVRSATATGLLIAALAVWAVSP